MLTIKKISPVLVLSFILFIGNAQENNIQRLQQRRNPLLGLHFTLSGNDFSKLNPGYFLSFTDGIAGKWDYMIEAGSLSPKHPLGDKEKTNDDLSHSLNVHGIYRFFTDTVVVNPFLNGGVGVNYYDNNVSGVGMLGGGLQVRFAKNIFLFTRVNYQINTSSFINNALQGNIGLMGTIYQRKAKRIAQPKVNSQPDNRLPSSVDKPVIDTDGDGIPDDQDSCKTIPGYAKYNGCPVPDRDGDGIPDDEDLCPDVPGIARLRGCPDTIQPVVSEVTKPSIDTLVSKVKDIAKQIYFETNSAVLKPESLRPLNEMADLLNKYRSYRLTIEGHTDNTGTDKRNKELSLQRAESVKNYLVSKGITAERLATAGFGATKPIADNSTSEGKARNRRTELILSK